MYSSIYYLKLSITHFECYSCLNMTYISFNSPLLTIKQCFYGLFSHLDNAPIGVKRANYPVLLLVYLSNLRFKLLYSNDINSYGASSYPLYYPLRAI